jgi:4'-phosphopantetheinyl transferase
MNAGAAGACRWQRLPSTGAAALWRIDLRQGPPDAALAELSQDERARAKRFRGDALARRYLSAHWALRRLLAEFTGRAPQDLQFDIGAHGKPQLRGEGPAFSLSRRGDVAVVGVLDDDRAAQVGVDVELLESMGDPLALAESVFSATERDALAAQPHASRQQAFLLGWTRKEACLKAIGCGLAFAPQGVRTGLTTEARALCLQTDAGTFELQVESLTDPGGGSVPAVVISWARSLRPDLRSSRP